MLQNLSAQKMSTAEEDSRSLHQQLLDFEVKHRELSAEYAEKERNFQKKISDLENQITAFHEREVVARDLESRLSAELQACEVKIQNYRMDLSSCRNRVAALENNLKEEQSAKGDAEHAELIEMKVSFYVMKPLYKNCSSRMDPWRVSYLSRLLYKRT